LDPTGDHLFSSNENSGTITVFKVDKATGSLTLLDVKAEIDTPGGLYFVQWHLGSVRGPCGREYC
jgi:6-phosphogluconolactonase (cycloisomerase 2 family)